MLRLILPVLIIVGGAVGPCPAQDAAKSAKPIKVFILAGDENVLEEGVIEARADAKHKPGTLTTVVADNPKYAFLKGKDGQWVTRDDVVLYDAHPVHNNTVRRPGRFASVFRAGVGRRPRRRWASTSCWVMSSAMRSMNR
jgi:hypothetical protein